MSDQAEQRDIQEIRNAVAFGLDAEAFMRTPIGRYLTAKANADIEQALEAMKTVDAEDPKAVRTLQNEIRSAEHFLHWMGEAVTAGENAQLAFVESQD